ncbi:DUF4129 domain-containing protein [Jatrophihabitans sp. YIM 134969]
MARDVRTAVTAGLAVALLGAVAAVAAHVPRPTGTTASPTSTATAPTRLTDTTAAPTPAATPWWLVVLGIVAIVVVIGPFVWLAVRHLRARRRGHDAERREGGTRRVARGRLLEADAALEDAATQLQAGGDPREVVVACWVRLEAAAEAAGRGRRPAETATDVARRWLEDDRLEDDRLEDDRLEDDRDPRSGEQRAAVDRLASLFHEARYSSHPMSERQRADARAALATLIGTRT